MIESRGSRKIEIDAFQIHVADKELIWLAFNGLLSYLRDKLDSTQF
jgi:hypothetical protein